MRAVRGPNIQRAARLEACQDRECRRVREHGPDLALVPDLVRDLGLVVRAPVRAARPLRAKRRVRSAPQRAAAAVDSSSIPRRRKAR